MTRTDALLRLRAPAKVNLTLHILGRREDGYHELDSLCAFAGAADHLCFQPGPPLTLAVTGPTAVSAGPEADNLVQRAAKALAALAPGLRLGAFHLHKTLPVAAGLGGGSSDAAAAIRALALANGIGLDDPRLMAAARASGSDVPVCLDPKARLMQGAGERVGPGLGMRPLPAVLVNPRVAVPTPQVFAALGLARGAGANTGPPLDLNLLKSDPFRALAQARNDMQPAAQRLAPAIGETLDLISATPGVRLARMSGSGATCFGLYEDRHAAARAARALRAARPAWWVRATLLR